MKKTRTSNKNINRLILYNFFLNNNPVGYIVFTSNVNSAGITEGFSMCGGDFVEVYSDPIQVGRRNSRTLKCV